MRGSYTVITTNAKQTYPIKKFEGLLEYMERKSHEINRIIFNHVDFTKPYLMPLARALDQVNIEVEYISCIKKHYVSKRDQSSHYYLLLKNSVEKCAELNRSDLNIESKEIIFESRNALHYFLRIPNKNDEICELAKTAAEHLAFEHSQCEELLYYYFTGTRARDDLKQFIQQIKLRLQNPDRRNNIPLLIEFLTFMLNPTENTFFPHESFKNFVKEEKHFIKNSLQDLAYKQNLYEKSYTQKNMTEKITFFSSPTSTEITALITSTHARRYERK